MQKIFDGMEHPGSAIQGNFDELVKKTGAGVVRTKPGDVFLIPGVGVVNSKEDPIRYWREGDTVFLSGSNIAFPSAKGNKKFWDIPSGFRPDTTVTVPRVAGDTAFHVMVLQFKADGAYIQYNDNNNGNQSVTGIFWHTNDAGPA